MNGRQRLGLDGPRIVVYEARSEPKEDSSNAVTDERPNLGRGDR